jgi:hypothetical protein
VLLQELKTTKAQVTFEHEYEYEKVQFFWVEDGEHEKPTNPQVVEHALHADHWVGR